MKGIPGPPGSCGTCTKPGALTETVLWDDNRKTDVRRLGLGRTVREAPRTLEGSGMWLFAYSSNLGFWWQSTDCHTPHPPG